MNKMRCFLNLLFTVRLRKKLRSLEDNSSLVPYRDKVYHYLTACGCSAGSFTLILFLLSYLCWLLINRYSFFNHFKVLITGTFLAALIGKIAGIVYYRIRAILILTKILDKN